MRVGGWRKTLGVLVCGTAVVLLAGGPVAADDKALEELKARLDRLEKQNEDLRTKLTTVGAPAPYQADTGEKEKINKMIDSYMQEKEAAKKAAPPPTPAPETEEGFKVGSSLGMSVRWNPAQGLLFETANKDFVSHIGFYMQWDTMYWTESRGLRPPGQVGDLEDGTLFRRIRPQYDGRAWDFVEWNAILALEQVQGAAGRNAAAGGVTSAIGNGGANINVDELWAGIYGVPILGRIRGGHLKINQGLEGDMFSSSRAMTFMERAAYTDAFYNNFATGVMILNSGLNDCVNGDRVTWQLSGYRDDNPRTNTGEDFGDGAYGVTGRVTALLLDEYEDAHFLHVGASATWRKSQNPAVGATGPATAQFRARPEQRDAIGGFGDTVDLPGDGARMVDTGAIVCNSQTVVGTELWYVLGPASVMAEWAFATMDSASIPVAKKGKVPAHNVVGNLDFNGGYVTCAYFLTGEHRAYDHTYGREYTFYIERPYTNFWAKSDEDGSWTWGLGAWEVAARYSYLNLNDGPIRGGVLQGLTFGLNWYLNNNFKIQFEYIDDQRWNKSTQVTTSPGAFPGVVQGFGTRMQIQF
jgi:phosphate-selective porin OprO/OprP